MDNNVIIGIYITGIKKRPELSNKPCVVQYLENEKKLVLSITGNDSVDNISIDRNKIINVQNVPRTIVSQDEFKNTSISEYDVGMLAIAFAGAYGNLISTLINKSGLLNSSNSGAVTYTSLNELKITYINEDEEQRNLIIQTDLNPNGIIDIINKSV